MKIRDDRTAELRMKGDTGEEKPSVQAVTNKNGVVVAVAAINSLQRRVSAGQTRLVLEAWLPTKLNRSITS